MNGAIATVLKDDEQIGGLLDWEQELIRGEGSDGANKTEKVLDWVIKARKSYHFADVEMPVTVVFYKFTEGKLYQVDRKVCNIEFTGDKNVVNGPTELWVAQGLN